MKKVLLEHPYHRKQVIAEADLSLALAGGWVPVIMPTKPPGLGAKRQKRYTERCREAGHKRLQVWLPAGVFKALLSQKCKTENLAELLERLIRHAMTYGKK